MRRVEKKARRLKTAAKISCMESEKRFSSLCFSAVPFFPSSICFSSMHLALGLTTLFILLISITAIAGFTHRENFLQQVHRPSVPIKTHVIAQSQDSASPETLVNPPAVHNIQKDKPSKLASFRKGLMLFTSTESLFRGIVSKILDDPDTAILVAKVLSYSFWIFFILVVFGTLGVDTKPLLSLFSVAGITIGFAAKDFITNCFAGMIILFTRPFERGYIISVGGMKGKVLSIDIRYVRLQKVEDGSEMLVPLSMVYNQVITIHEPKSTETSNE